MITKAIHWPEDLDGATDIPFLELNDPETVHYLRCKEAKYTCYQPDEIEDEEFNMIILLEDRPIRVRGIHFDFVEE